MINEKLLVQEKDEEDEASGGQNEAFCLETDER